MQKKLLYEVSIIRPLVIFLMVVMHAFTIFAGGWEPIPGVDTDIPIYYYLVKFITGFRIESIALIAGYVYAYQYIELKRYYKFTIFAWKKFKRLLLPCYFFGLLYYLLLKYNPETFSVTNMLMIILDGAGHLWFLPMLFWCFLVMWWIVKKQMNEHIAFMMLFCFSVLPMVKLPLGFDRVFHYLFYFYGGYLMYKYKQEILKRLAKWHTVVLLTFIYVVFLQIKILITNWYSITSFSGILPKVSILTVCNILSAIVSVSGIFALYIVVCHKTENVGYVPKKWVLWSSSVCYGVYVYHQMILEALYYKTQFPSLVSSYLLPWYALIIALILSLLFTVLTLKTKFGRFLIG